MVLQKSLSRKICDGIVTLKRQTGACCACRCGACHPNITADTLRFHFLNTTGFATLTDITQNMLVIGKRLTF